MKKKLFPLFAAATASAFLFFASSSCEKGVYPAFTLSEDTLTFGYAADSAEILLSSNVDWWIYTKPTYATMSPLGGKGNAAIKVYCDTNSTADRRDTVIAVTTETIRHEITIIQDPNPNATPDPDAEAATN